MNDDPSLTPAADQPTTSDNTTTQAAEVADANNEETPQGRLRKRIFAQTKRKAEFVHDIIVNLDMLIYAELCALYYMDCSFFRFLIRALTQVTFLTPNPKSLQPMPKHRPYIPVILGTNAFCLFLHMITSRPEAGELTRGYLHGGIIIDFIGQKGPTSKIVLVVLDLIVLALQCFMLAVHVEQERLKTALASREAMTELAAAMTVSQDHDAEERGVIRDSGINSNDIELQQIASSRTGINDPIEDNQEERDLLLAERVRRAEGEADDGPLDLFYSGNVIVSDFHVLHTLRTQFNDHENAATTALHTVGHTAGYEWARVQHRVMSRLDTLR